MADNGDEVGEADGVGRDLGCRICLDSEGDPKPIQCGCACRGEAGLAHIECNIVAAEHFSTGFHKGWYHCSTCNQDYTGEMHLRQYRTYAWCVVRGAWCAVRGARCAVRGARCAVRSA